MLYRTRVQYLRASLLWRERRKRLESAASLLVSIGMAVLRYFSADKAVYLMIFYAYVNDSSMYVMT